MLLIIDNYDSFTYNLVQRIGEHDISASVQREVAVIRNDQITLEEAVALNPNCIVISPGPCTPTESGVSKDIVRHFQGLIPLLGVCLGHQVIGEVNGMTVSRYDKPVHGKTSEVFHDNTGVFAGLPNPFVATRYHSLVLDPVTIPDSFTMNAWTSDGVCMGICNESNGSITQGVQFHPESFLTETGPQLLANFLTKG